MFTLKYKPFNPELRPIAVAIITNMTNVTEIPMKCFLYFLQEPETREESSNKSKKDWMQKNSILNDNNIYNVSYQRKSFYTFNFNYQRKAW